MKRFGKGKLRAVWCVISLLLIGGCDMSSVHVMLLDFRDGEVDGIWLWRQHTTGQYYRLCKFEISDPYTQYGSEVVSYDETCYDGLSADLSMQTEVVRSAADPDSVSLRLQYRRGSRTKGIYRASAYNASGESVLSSASVQL